MPEDRLEEYLDWLDAEAHAAAAEQPAPQKENKMKGDNVLFEQFYDVKSTGVDMNDHAWVRASAKNRGLNAIAGLTKREYQALVRRVSHIEKQLGTIVFDGWDEDGRRYVVGNAIFQSIEAAVDEMLFRSSRD